MYYSILLNWTIFPSFSLSGDAMRRRNVCSIILIYLLALASVNLAALKFSWCFALWELTFPVSRLRWTQQHKASNGIEENFNKEESEISPVAKNFFEGLTKKSVFLSSRYFVWFKKTLSYLFHDSSLVGLKKSSKKCNFVKKS